jgi:hypothetical protein
MKTYEVEVINPEDPVDMPAVFFVTARNNAEARKKARRRVRGRGKITSVHLK